MFIRRSILMKKTIALIMAILLSVTIFVSDIAGITMIVHAEDYSDDGDYEEPSYEEPQIEPEVPDMPVDDPQDDPAPVEPAPVDPDPVVPDPMPPVLPPQPDPEEEARRAAEEAARQEAAEKAAREAQEAQEKAEADAAAQEAQRLAEEAAKKAAQEAADAAKAEEKEKAAQGENYSLVATVGAGTVSRLSFGSAMVGEQRDYFPVVITNTGNTHVDLIYAKTNDADNAFSMTLHGDATSLDPGESTKFNISMSSSLGVGEYTAYVKFADDNDPNFSRALTLTVTGTVTPRKEVVTSVTVTPARIALAKGASARFHAEVNGNADLIYEIIWTINGNSSTGTSISKDGVLMIASNETSSTINVFATTTVDPSVKGTAVVSVQSGSYNVNAYANPLNGGKVTGGGAVAEGGSVTLSAIPNKNFYFGGWVIGGKTVSTATNYTITNVRTNMDVTAVFGQNYVTVSVGSNNPNGGVVAGGGSIPYGGSTTISAKACDGYVFSGWVEGHAIVSKDATVKLTNLTVDRKFTAAFEKTSHTLTVVAYPSEGGTVSGGGTFKLNEGTTINASPASGYTFLGWQANGQYVSRNPQYVIDKVSQDYTITGVFIQNSAITYELSSGVATTGGSISPSGKLTVVKGQSVTYTITPKSGFAILAVAVDGAQVGPVSAYTFSNIDANHMIAAAFVQTDAGKAAAAASGKVTQADKVKPLEKTLNNTATNNSTVDLDEAANGEGGDNFVEEMDLSDIEIPTDEQLGITEVTEAEPESDVVIYLGKTIDEVNDMVRDGDTMTILDAAFYTGHLGAYVYNKFEPESMLSVDYNNMTPDELMQTPDSEINPSLPDLDIVVQKMLSNDDVAKLVKGGHLDVSVSITSQDEPDEPSVKIMKNAIGKKPMQYFDITMLKSVDGLTEKVTELPTTMEVIMQIPKDIYKSGKTYSVLRVHNGELKVLPDLDDDPETITFRTDRFSVYAIAQDVTTANGLVAWLVAGAVIALGVALTCLLILIEHHRRMRRQRHKKAYT